MEKLRFNSILSHRELEYGCALSKSMEPFDFGPIENTSTSISDDPVRNDTDKNIHVWGEDSTYDSNVDHLIGAKDIHNFISDDIFFIFYFQNFEIDNDHSFLSELENFFYSYWNYSYMNHRSKSDDDLHSVPYMYHTKYSWNNHINSCVDSYLHSQICINSSILSGSDNYNDSYFSNYICGESGKSSEGKNSNKIKSSVRSSEFSFISLTDLKDSSDDLTDLKDSSDDLTDLKENSDDLTDLKDSSDDLTDLKENSDDLDTTQKYKHLWSQCESCYELNYKKFLKSKMNICEQCGYYLKMSSSDRIELSIDPGTWNPMDEDMVSLDPIEFDSEEESYKEESYKFDSEEESYFDSEEESYKFDSEEESYFDSEEESDKEESYKFDSEEESYKDRLNSYQKKTGLTDAVQTGTGQLNGIPVALGVMDFQFMGGSMGSVVGEKITRLIEYATNKFLPLILVCASGGARMQEGSLSLMQMAKISSVLYDYQSNKKLFYVSILTSPTTGGVTASFGMLGDIIIAEPNAYIAFAGKRVIEQTLNKTVPEGSQVAEYLFQKGLLDSIVPRNPLKGVLSELLQLHTFFPLNQNSIK